MRCGNYLVFLSLVFSLFSFSNLYGAGKKKFLVSLPIITVGREAITKLEYNTGSAGSVALEWSLLDDGQELRKHELEVNPQHSLMAKGQELALVFSRFSNAHDMSGWFWNLSLGYRKISGTWKKDPFDAETRQRESLSLYVNDEGLVTHKFGLEGTTVSGRCGYRFVGNKYGLVAGVYLGIRHFQNKVNDYSLNQQGELEASLASEMPQQDKISLKRRFMSSFQPGFELGWAF